MSKQNYMEKVLALDFCEDELRQRTNNDFLVKTCPYCRRRFKMNINLSKQCFRCPACDESGNAFKLHAHLRGISEDAAREELGSSKVKTEWIQTDKFKEIETYSSYIRTLYYARMLNSGKLEKKHAENLKARGLKNLDGYVSCSSIPEIKKIFKGVKTVLVNYNYGGEPVIKGIPGFYGEVKFSKSEEQEDFSQLKINLPSDGFLIPIMCNEDGLKRLSCFQIRRDKGETRYIYLSSVGKPNGVGVEQCDKVHYSDNCWTKEGHLKPIPKVMNLTEGALKANVAAELSGAPFIAIPGVNAYRDLAKQLEYLKANGCEQINIYFDMDSYENPQVEKALQKVQSIISDSGLKCVRVNWDRNFKGIDDYLLNQKTKKH